MVSRGGCSSADQRLNDIDEVLHPLFGAASGPVGRIEDAGQVLGAIYHSHTRTEPRPSQTDINFAKLWPDVLWIIVGLADGHPDVRTWRIDDGRVSDAELVVE